jgi:hypothetical protein
MKYSFTHKITWVVLPIFMAGCVSLPPPGTRLTAQQRADAQKSCVNQYVAGGAIGGALLGMLISSKRDRAQGAVVGAIAGGALAHSIAWGKCLAHYSDINSFPVADAQQTAAAVGYTASRGDEVRIQNFTVSPSQLAPGNSFKFSGTYYVMSPQGQKQVKVVESSTLHYFNPEKNAWQELGTTESQVTAALSSRRAESPVDMPSEVAEGRYRLTFKVSALGKEDQASQEIVIKKT